MWPTANHTIRPAPFNLALRRIPQVPLQPFPQPRDPLSILFARQTFFANPIVASSMTAFKKRKPILQLTTIDATCQTIRHCSD
jgi:hypothetical protein